MDESKINSHLIHFSEASMINWQDEIKQFWLKIKEEAKSSLKLIKQGRIRSGLVFDEIFKENFLRSANSKYENFIPIHF